jgi:hypothetical protein
MLAKVNGINRGYFELDRVYEGKPYKQRFLQIETENADGQIKIDRVRVPVEKVEKACDLPVLEEIEIEVDFSVYKGYLNIALV